MRARNIKPGFFDNDLLAECAPHARLLFIGLWCCADREGRLEDRPARIAARVFPFERDIDIEALLTELDVRGFIARYESQGVKAIEVVNFSEHQRPHKKEAPSKIGPRPGKGRTQTRPRPGRGRAQTGASRADSLNEDSLNPKCGMLNGSADAFDRFWEAFPAGRKHSKARARAAFTKAAAKTDPEAIIAAAVEYAASPVGRGQYVKGPEPWLNGECWDDDRAAWQRSDAPANAKPLHHANLEPF